MFHVIAQRDSEYLETPVLHTANETEEAVAVFTDHAAAERYIDAAGWHEQFEVGSIDALQLLCWLVQAYVEGTALLAVDPEYGMAQHMASIGQHLTDSAERLAGELLAIRSS